MDKIVIPKKIQTVYKILEYTSPSIFLGAAVNHDKSTIFGQTQIDPQGAKPQQLWPWLPSGPPGCGWHEDSELTHALLF